MLKSLCQKFNTFYKKSNNDEINSVKHFNSKSLVYKQ